MLGFGLGLANPNPNPHPKPNPNPNPNPNPKPNPNPHQVARDSGPETQMSGGKVALDDPPPSMADAESSAVSELVAMGFNEDRVREALSKADGSLEKALDILTG